MDAEGEAEEGADDNALYCFCQEKSYGEMIGCDNEECRFEWVSPGLDTSLRRARTDTSSPGPIAPHSSISNASSSNLPCPRPGSAPIASPCSGTKTATGNRNRSKRGGRNDLDRPWSFVTAPPFCILPLWGLL